MLYCVVREIEENLGVLWYLHTLRDRRCVTKIFRKIVALLDPRTKPPTSRDAIYSVSFELFISKQKMYISSMLIFLTFFYSFFLFFWFLVFNFFYLQTCQAYHLELSEFSKFQNLIMRQAWSLFFDFQRKVVFHAGGWLIVGVIA